MTRDRFRWSDATQLFVQGHPIGGAPSQAPALAREIRALRNAILGGRDFSVGPDGIGVLPQSPAAAGVFHSRSGGTTGAAKAIRRSHSSWIASFDIARDHFDLSARDVYGVLSLPSHSLALFAIVEAAHLGADLHLLAGLHPRAQVAQLVQAGATVLYATPTQLRLLCDAGGEIPSLRQILCGGGRMPQGLRSRLAALCPQARLTEFYGTSETSFIAWGDGTGPDGAVGKAYPGVDIDIRNPVDDTGEIWVRSPYLFDGYAEGHSSDTRWDDGFLTVGELGRLDAAGHVFVAGRHSRMVTIAGQNVFPEDIEVLLQSRPDIPHCAVMPLPDDLRGTVLVAVIAGQPDAGQAQEVIARCRAAFGPLAAPRQVIALPDFPLLASGKPDLRTIAALLEART
jgi:long-chain acyl-CoA synthetase